MDQRLTRTPLYPTSKTPEEIIGIENMPILKAHFKIALKEKYTGDYGKAMQKYSEAERVYIAELYQKLRDYGIYPKGLDGDNKIVLGITVESDLQEHIKKKYPLKCDNCNCPEGVCNGYNKEQIEYFKKLARERVPISAWPEKVFNRG